MTLNPDVHLRFETTDRRYTITLQPDLFGDLVLTRRWWGKHNSRGNFKSEYVPSEILALQRLQQELKRRKYRGYTCTSLAELADVVLLSAVEPQGPPEAGRKRRLTQDYYAP